MAARLRRGCFMSMYTASLTSSHEKRMWSSDRSGEQIPTRKCGDGQASCGVASSAIAIASVKRFQLAFSSLKRRRPSGVSW